MAYENAGDTVAGAIMVYENAGDTVAGTIMAYGNAGDTVAGTIMVDGNAGDTVAEAIMVYGNAGDTVAEAIMVYENAGDTVAGAIMVYGNAGDTVAGAIMAYGNAGDTVAGILWTEAAPPEALFPRWRPSPGWVTPPSKNTESPTQPHQLCRGFFFMYGRTPKPTHTIGTGALLHDHLMNGTILQGDHVRTATHRDRRVAFGQVNALH